METRRAICLGDVRVIGKPEDRTLRMWITDETRDRYNSVISVRGWQLENYLKNPVFLWAHEHEGLPIGHAVATGTVEERRPLARDSKRQGTFRRMYADTKFATRDEYAFADVVYRLYLGKHLRATSVGFRPVLEKRVQTIEEIEEDTALADFTEVRPGDVVYLKQEMAEYSSVPIPGNQNALVDELAGMVPALRSGDAQTQKIVARAAVWMDNAINGHIVPDADPLGEQTIGELLAHVRILLASEKQTPTKVVVSVPDPTVAKTAVTGDGGGSSGNGDDTTAKVSVKATVSSADPNWQPLVDTSIILSRIDALEKKIEERFFLFSEPVKQSHIVGLAAQLSDVLHAVEELKARNPEAGQKATAPGAKREGDLYDGVLAMTAEQKRLIEPLVKIEAATRKMVPPKASPVKVKLPPSGAATDTGTAPQVPPQ